LNGIELQGLKGQNLPQILVGQITSRQYHYNPLSELIAIQMPDETLGFGYDAAGRLRSQAHYDTREYMQALEGQATPHTTRRWKIDPAGNRLPGKVITEQQQQQNWVEQVRQRWQDPEFNLLGEGSARQQQQGPINQWPDNRIAFDEHSAWRYSDQGNRVEQMSQTPQRYERQRLYFDGANQLTALQVDGADGHNPIAMRNAARYIYDALGRRLKKTVRDSTGKDHVTYFGWDGDRQVHTETVKEDGTREIVHIIYEPGTFTPMVRLSTTVSAKAWQPKPHFIVQAALAGLTQRQKNNDEIWDDLQNLQNALERMADEKSDQLNKNFRRALRQDPPTNRLVGLGPHLDNMMTLEDMRRGLQEQEAQEIKTPIAVHYFHTDHLGTPLALTDQSGKMVWATRLDPWGNVEDEYNPQGLEQNIRLPGQYFDRESGLYYNRFRYYDPKIGGYINQDPIGLRGGNNLTQYSNDPLFISDPLGLAGKPGFGTQNAAATSAVSNINDTSVKEATEYGGMICKNSEGRYSFTKPNKGDKASVDPGGLGACGKKKATAYYHTHGDDDPNYDNENFSPEDESYAQRNKIDGYLETPKGAIKYYNSTTNVVTVLQKGKP
jgi:RHS repeat-associated protein